MLLSLARPLLFQQIPADKIKDMFCFNALISSVLRSHYLQHSDSVEAGEWIRNALRKFEPLSVMVTTIFFDILNWS